MDNFIKIFHEFGIIFNAISIIILTVVSVRMQRQMEVMRQNIAELHVAYFKKWVKVLEEGKDDDFLQELFKDGRQ